MLTIVFVKYLFFQYWRLIINCTVFAGAKTKYAESAQIFIISERLKEARKEANMTQEQLAEKTGTKKKLHYKNWKWQRKYSTFYFVSSISSGIKSENRVNFFVKEKIRNQPKFNFLTLKIIRKFAKLNPSRFPKPWRFFLK